MPQPLHLFVTGSPGCGKSTLIHRVLQQLGDGFVRSKAQGFWTEEVRVAGERAGFDVVTLGGQRGVLARAGGAAKGPTVGKYVVNVASFEALALPQLQPRPGVELYVVDEVGKMELLSPKFFPAVTALLDAAPLVIGTLPVARYGRTIPQVEALKRRPGVEVITVTKENRDQATQQVLQRVRQALEAAGGKSGRDTGSG